MRRKKPRSYNKDVRDLVREVPYRGVGGIASPEGAMFLQWESYLEKLAINTLLLCHDVQSISTQQTFRLEDGSGKEIKYTPDIQILHKGRWILIEVKPLIRLLDPDTRLKLANRSALLSKHGYALHFLTDDHLNQKPQSDNVQLLARYKNHPIPSHKLRRILESVGEYTTINSLLDFDRCDQFLSNIYAMIAQKHLWVEINKPISLNSCISLPGHGNGGLSYEQISTTGRVGSILERLVLEGGQEADRWLAIEKARGKQRLYHGPEWFW